MPHPVATFTQIRAIDFNKTIFEDDIYLYGWSVVWEFACYLTDQLIDEEFGRDPMRPSMTACQWLPFPSAARRPYAPEPCL